MTARSVRSSPPETAIPSPLRGLTPPHLYVLWTGDDAHGMKQAEHLAWKVEDIICSAGLDEGDRIGSEAELASLFGMGAGATREAIELLEVFGMCATRRGPGGGIFVGRPNSPMTVQAIVNYLIRVGVSGAHVRDARALAHHASAAAGDNTVIILFRECVDRLDQIRRLTDDGAIEPHAGTAFLSERRIVWQNHSGRPLSAAQTVGLLIANAIITQDLATGCRLGSEEDLRATCRTGKVSMRHATRLLEYTGLVESRPGRGRGLHYAAPSEPRLIRRLGSFFSARHVSDGDAAAALRLFGFASLDGLLGSDPWPAAQATERARRAVRPTGEMRDIDEARLMLRLMIEASPNPIVSLFWKGAAGYIFRAFSENELVASRGHDALRRSILDVLEAGRSKDRDGIRRSYDALFPAGMGWSRATRRLPGLKLGRRLRERGGDAMPPGRRANCPDLGEIRWI